ncbi:metallophosphoesterase family protein [Microvirga guangxiensis]|uniref:DNA repair exonuclease SbcCD nuclease subunit n=1 Tax=Microvirga guangxiensis TaxID=549386 RepID=A0A1G5HN13_9HYPH|nr:DNA repair exonuclease [Microvirga guangxiensis]SCY65262.1 DNA repair exonuclease SbcCD nuclease subunit [Microvirga guangxiensis]
MVDSPSEHHGSNVNFSFLHAADLHLGSPLLGLSVKDPEIARRFATASREAFRALIDRAISAKVAFAVIAGDIYDGEWKDNTVGLFFNREISRLTREGVPVYIIKGNHDAESVVTKTVPKPDGVTVFGTRKAETHRIEHLKVAVHGWSYEDRATAADFSLSYPAAVPGWFNIGVLHSSCEGKSAHATYAPCSVQELSSHEYQYWALGHIHEHKVLSRDPWIVYPGNLQGRSVRECGAKGAVIVEVRDGEVRAVERAIVDSARWAAITVDVSSLTTETEVTAAVRKEAESTIADLGERLLALRVTLTGETSLHDRLRAAASTLRDEVQAVLHHVHEDTWLEKLEVRTSAPLEPQERALGGLDPIAMLAGLTDDIELRQSAGEIVGTLLEKLPQSFSEVPELNDIDMLMAEARSLVVARATAGKAV